jgi:hypothetical protein
VAGEQVFDRLAVWRYKLGDWSSMAGEVGDKGLSYLIWDWL